MIKLLWFRGYLTCIMSFLKAPTLLNDLGAKFTFHVYTMDTRTQIAFWPSTTEGENALTSPKSEIINRR